MSEERRLVGAAAAQDAGGPHNVCEPDLLFISRERLSILTEDNVQGAPDLAVEVLSEWNRRRDLKSKMGVYARFGVRVYWVADPEEDVVRVFERRGETLAELRPPLQAGARLGCELFPGVEADVASLSARALDLRGTQPGADRSTGRRPAAHAAPPAGALPLFAGR